MSDTPLIRLTFNHPAMRTYFSDDTVGVRVRFDGRNTVLFKPTVNTDAVDSLKLVARGGRGKQIVLTGEMSETLLAALTANNDTDAYPYFVLKTDKNGWFRLEHHSDDEAPRLIPHVRLWIPRDGHYTPPPTSAELPADFGVMLATFTTSVRQADTLIRDHAAQRKVGRPPVEVQQAKDFITSFTQLYQANVAGAMASA